MKRVDLRLSDELHDRVTRYAARERRSAHAQLILFIENALDAHDVPPPAELPGQTAIAVPLATAARGADFRPDPKPGKK